VKIAAVGAMGLLAVGFAVLFFFRVAPPPDASEPPPRPGRTARGKPRAAALEVFRDELCFVDANGDDVPDPVVWMSDGMAESRVAAVDGKTGQGLWASPAADGRWALACAGDAVIAGAGEAAARAIDARSGKERWNVPVLAAPEEIVVGEGCVAVLGRTGPGAGLRLDSGEAAPCPSAARPGPLAGPLIERARNPRVLQAGDVELRLSAATDVERRLTIEGRRDGATIWTLPLNARAPGPRGDMLLVASGGMAVVAGADPGGSARLQLVGVEIASGKLVYEQPAAWAGSYIAALEASGPRVLVIAGGSLRALDAATGKEAWQAIAPPSLR
jgi:outer membrane protein assembly factor BamB